MFITGRAVVLAALGAVALAVVPGWSTALVWLGLVVAVILVDVAAAGRPRDVVVTRQVTEVVRLGETGYSTLLLEVPGRARRRLRGSVRDAWSPSAGAGFGSEGGPGVPRGRGAGSGGAAGSGPSGGAGRHLVDIPAGERRRVTTPLNPSRRGTRRADQVTIRALGPLGVAGRQASRTVPGSILVLPPFHARRHLPSRLATLREMDGRSAMLTRGQGTEFDSLREYVIGDDVRAIDWRATARARDVMVRTWRPERERRVFVVIDSGRLGAVRLGDETRLDAQIDAALLLAALASHAGDRVDVVAVDTALRARVAGRVGPALMSSLARELSIVEPALVETDWQVVGEVVRRSVAQRALVVLLTALDSSTLQGGLLEVARGLAGDHIVVVASALDGAEEAALAWWGAGGAGGAGGRGAARAGQVYLAAAAERGALERAAAALRLRQRGIEVVEAGADQIATALADTYLRLKRAGRL